MTFRVILLLALLVPVGPPGKEENSLDLDRMKRHVDALCSPSLEGRMALNAGGRRAAEYIARAFAEAGLKPLPAPEGDSGEGGKKEGGAGAFLLSRKVVVDVMDKDILVDGEDRMYQVTPCGISGETCNLVVGVIRGRSRRSENPVLVTARYDGPGMDGAKVRFPGADRNASGVAVLLETARAFAAAGSRVRRDVVFAALPAGEAGLFMRRPGAAEYERLNNWVVKYLVQAGEWDTFLESRVICLPGLAGAEAWLADAPFPVERIHTVVDLNMVGGTLASGAGEGDGESAFDGESASRRDGAGTVAVVGGETGEGLAKSLSRATAGLKPPPSMLPFEELVRRHGKRITESCEFLRKRIPCVWITTGPQEYHGTADDTVDRLDSASLEGAARAACGIIRTLANEKDSHPFKDA